MIRQDDCFPSRRAGGNYDAQHAAAGECVCRAMRQVSGRDAVKCGACAGSGDALRMFALSAPGKLDEVLAAVGLSSRRDDTLDATVVFPDLPAAVAAFLSAGATTLALRHSDPAAVEKAVYDALDPFIGDLGQVTLPGWFRVVETS